MDLMELRKLEYIELKNKMPARDYRQGINYNFALTEEYLNNFNSLLEKHTNQIDNTQDLALSNYKRIEELMFTLENEIDVIINTRKHLLDLEEEIINIKTQMEKPRGLKKFFRWLFQSDGVETPKTP
jgi:hypothetical protein